MPVDYSKYPENWRAIIEQVRARAGDRCEFCGVPNGATIARDDQGRWRYQDEFEPIAFSSGQGRSPLKLINIVLTTAHLDHDSYNPDVPLSRLAYLCQRCHLRYDRRFPSVEARQIEVTFPTADGSIMGSEWLGKFAAKRGDRYAHQGAALRLFNNPKEIAEWWKAGCPCFPRRFGPLAWLNPEWPIINCPACGKGHEDADGYGVLACLGPGGCGYCSHPSIDTDAEGRDICATCGQAVR